MSLSLIVPPETLPVTVEELKTWGRIVGDDALLNAIGDAATTFVQTALGRQLVTATYEYTARSFPCDILRLQRPPLQDIVTVKYRGTDGEVVTLAAGIDYLVDTFADPGTVEPVRSWPRTGDYPDAVQVRFIAGFGDAVDVPENMKTCIKALATWWYEQRTAVSQAGTETIEGVGSKSHGGPMHQAPMHVGALIDQARLWHLS